jgi:hypothetical protein
MFLSSAVRDKQGGVSPRSVSFRSRGIRKLFSDEELRAVATTTTPMAVVVGMWNNLDRPAGNINPAHPYGPVTPCVYVKLAGAMQSIFLLKLVAGLLRS